MSELADSMGMSTLPPGVLDKMNWLVNHLEFYNLNFDVPYDIFKVSLRIKPLHMLGMEMMTYFYLIWL